MKLIIFLSLILTGSSAFSYKDTFFETQAELEAEASSFTCQKCASGKTFWVCVSKGNGQSYRGGACSQGSAAQEAFWSCAETNGESNCSDPYSSCRRCGE